MDLDKLSYAIIGVAMKVHNELGSGMTEAAYEAALCHALAGAGHNVRAQVPVELNYEGARVAKAFRIDLVVDDRVIVEIKVVKAIGLHHIKQVAAYLKLTQLKLGLILNFGAPSLRYGIKRIVNGL